MKYINNHTVEFETEEELNSFKSFIRIQDKSGTMKAGEVMKLLNISRETLCHYKSWGWIKAVKVGGQFRYDSGSVYELLESNRKAI